MVGVFCNIRILPWLRLSVQTVRRRHLIGMKNSHLNPLLYFTAVEINGNSPPDTLYFNQKSHEGVEAKWKGVARSPWMFRSEESEECRFAHQKLNAGRADRKKFCLSPETTRRNALGNRTIKTYQRTHFWEGPSVHAEVPCWLLPISNIPHGVTDLPPIS